MSIDDLPERHPDSPVPDSQALACTLWKCYYAATYGWGDGSVTWWTLQPIERQWWIATAERFEESAHLAEREASIEKRTLREAADDVERECSASREACFCSSAPWLRDRADRIGGTS